MCGQHNGRASAEDSTGLNTDKWNTPNPRIGIKIPDSAGYWTRAAGLEGRDAIDHATAVDILQTPGAKYIFTILKLLPNKLLKTESY